MIEFKDTKISLSRDGGRNLSVSFRLSPGDLAILIGPNGSGKTTVLDIIAGIRKVDAGTVTVEPAASPIAYVVQDSASGLLPWRTILSNILLPAQLQKSLSNGSVEKAESLLTTFGLTERKDDYPYKLSEGEKQLVNIIRAVSTPASILLLDEPFSSLNAIARSRAKAILLESAAGRTTLLVTHDPADLDWPITRCLQIINSQLVETNILEAKEFLENVVSKAPA
jgi:NitT/TauT family transport system ATP-binding protein